MESVFVFKVCQTCNNDYLHLVMVTWLRWKAMFFYTYDKSILWISLDQGFFLLHSVVTGCTDGIGKAYTHEVQWTFTTAVITFFIVDTWN